MLASPAWLHTQNWLTMSQNTFFGDMDRAWDGRLDDAVRCGVAIHTGRAKLISALDTLCNACAVESEYTNLSIIDIFRMPPSSGLLFSMVLLWSTMRGLRNLPVSSWPSGRCFWWQRMWFRLALAETVPDQTRPDQTRPDQTRPDQTRPDLGGLYAVIRLGVWHVRVYWQAIWLEQQLWLWQQWCRRDP